MVPRTVRNSSGSVSEFYLCDGRKLDPKSCDVPPTRRAEIDEAVFTYFEQVGLDLDATREQIQQAVDHKLTEVRALCEAAEKAAQEATERLARVKRDYTHGDLTASEWRELRVDLAEREAAFAEVERLRQQCEAAEQSARSSTRRPS